MKKAVILSLLVLLLTACGDGGGGNPQTTDSCVGPVPCFINHAEDPEYYFVFNPENPHTAQYYNFKVFLMASDVVRVEFIWRRSPIEQINIALYGLAYDCYHVEFYGGSYDEVSGELFLCEEVLKIIDLVTWIGAVPTYWENIEVYYMER